MSTENITNKHLGSSLDDFLKEEGIYEECHTQAVKEVLAWQLEYAISYQIRARVEDLTNGKFNGRSHILPNTGGG